jgi:thiol-disulfide isomerase/thioredoxin
MVSALTLSVLAAVCATASAGKFDKYTDCEMCIEAGWGWNEAKGKCGAFPNKVCKGSKAVVVLPPYDGNVQLLDDDTFETFVDTTDIIMVEFFAPWCGHCKKLDPIYSAAAQSVYASKNLPNVKFAKVDTTDENSAKTKAAYGITGFPSVFIFRSGEKLYKVLEEPGDRNVGKITHLLSFENSQPAPPPPGAPIFLKFDLEGSSKLMEHKIKSQIAFFYSSGDPGAKGWIDAYEQTATKFAGKIIALYVDVDDPKNNPVLGRFNVNSGTVPCLRVAQIYEAGGGMEIYMPDPKANPKYQDRKVKSAEALDSFVTDHLATGDPLKGGRITIPYLRSEPRPMKSHPAVTDLVGNTYDAFIGKKSRSCLSFFYMPTCPHCAELEPHWESVATEIKKLNKNRPAVRP